MTLCSAAPYAILIVFMALCVAALAEEPSQATQMEALMEVYRTMGGDQWRISYNWGNGADYCVWHDDGKPRAHGITCDVNGNVVALVLPARNNIIGTLSPYIGNLTALRNLEIPGQLLLVDPIPPTIGKLTALETMIFSDSSFMGDVPAEIGELTSLTVLDLGGNIGFTGIFPSVAKLAKLTSLSLWGNLFDGFAADSCGKFANLSLCEIGDNSKINLNHGADCPACLNSIQVCHSGDWPLKVNCSA